MDRRDSKNMWVRQRSSRLRRMRQTIGRALLYLQTCGVNGIMYSIKSQTAENWPSFFLSWLFFGQWKWSELTWCIILSQCFHWWDMRHDMSHEFCFDTSKVWGLRFFHVLRFTLTNKCQWSLLFLWGMFLSHFHIILHVTWFDQMMFVTLKHFAEFIGGSWSQKYWPLQDSKNPKLQRWCVPLRPMVIVENVVEPLGKPVTH